MFATLEGFSIFFFSVAGLLLAGILFEEKFIALEDKFDKKRSEKRNDNCNFQNEEGYEGAYRKVQ